MFTFFYGTQVHQDAILPVCCIDLEFCFLTKLFYVFKAIREMREHYMKKLAILRGMHAKQWEEFLQLDAQRQHQRARQQMSGSGFGGGYKQASYSDYDGSSTNPHFAGPNLPMDSRGRYPSPVENYPPSRPHDTYSDFQRQRREDIGKAYHRY